MPAAKGSPTDGSNARTSTIQLSLPLPSNQVSNIKYVACALPQYYSTMKTTDLHMVS